MKEKRQCAEKNVCDPGLWPRFHPCRLTATVEEDGKWWCKTHAPSAVKARREKSTEKWDKEMAEHLRDFAMRKACAGVATEDLTPGLLKRLMEQTK